MKQSINVQGEHGHQGVPKRMPTAFSGSTGDSLSSCVWDALTVLWSFQPVAVLLARQTAQLSLPESKEDNAARGAATVLKTDVYPCTLMQ